MTPDDPGAPAPSSGEGTGPSPQEVARRAERVRDRIAGAGGDPERVRILAVSKGFAAPVARAAVAAGFTDLGENYAQELQAKATELTEPVRWHFIGRLQTNKVKALAGVVAWWQTVDRPELAAEIARRAPGASVLVQVNVSAEPTKGGCDPGATPDLVGRARDLGLHVQGLMTVGRTGPPAQARAGFDVLRDLADRLELPERSMGMSGDLEEAVRAGSTMVRIGSALFGDRPPR